MGLECAQIDMLGGILMEMWGLRARIELPKLAENILNNQQGLEVTKKSTGGMAWMGGDEDQ
jgi:hypothetical protein